MRTLLIFLIERYDKAFLNFFRKQDLVNYYFSFIITVKDILLRKETKQLGFNIFEDCLSSNSWTGLLLNLT